MREERRSETHAETPYQIVEPAAEPQSIPDAPTYFISMSHKCKFFILYCMDFRLEGALDKWLDSQGIHLDTDQVSLAGACKELVEKRSVIYRIMEWVAKKFGILSPKYLLLKQIELSQKLHGVTNIIILNHTTCGAYGGDDSRHKDDMRKARALIQKLWPNLEVRLVLMHVKEDKTIEFEDIE